MARSVPRVGRISVAQRPSDCVLLVRVFSAPGTKEALLGVVVRIKRPWLAAAQVIQQMVATVKRSFEIEDGQGSHKFERIVRSVNELLQSLAHQGEASWLGHLDGTILLLSEDELHFTTTGQMNLWLRRGNQLKMIAAKDSPSDKAPEIFPEIVTGELKAGDVLFVMPAELETLIAEDELLEFLGFPARVAIRQIARPLMKQKLTNLAGLVVELREPNQSFDDEGLPEVIYLDQPLESTFMVILRYLGPLIRSLRSHTRSMREIHLPKWTAQGRVRLSRGEELVGRLCERLRPTINGGLGSISRRGHGILTNLPLDHLIRRLEPLRDPLRRSITPVYLRISRLLERIEVRLKGAWLGLEPEKRSRLLLPLLSILLVLITITNIRAERGRRAEKLEKVRETDVLRIAESSLKTAIEDVSRKSNESAQSAVETGLIAINKLPAGEQAGRIAQLKLLLEEQYDQLTGSVRLRSPRGTFSLAGARGSVTLFEGNLIGAAPNSAELTLKPLSPTSTERNVPLPAQSGQPQFLERASTEVVVVTEGGRVYLMTDPSRRLVEAPVATTDQSVGTPVAVGTFGRHLYVLESDGDLFRFPREAEGFGDRIPFIEQALAKPTEPVDLTIDGFIYVLKSDGSIVKYLKGVPQTGFSVRDIPSPHETIARPQSLTTDSDSNALYVLDAGNPERASPSRVIELEKDGKFSRQYLLPTSGPLDLIVNEKARTIWVVYEHRVLEFSL